MEPIYKCSFCGFMGTRKDVETHEAITHNKITSNDTNNDTKELNINVPSVFFKTDFEMRRTNSNNKRYPIVYEIVKWYNTDHPIKCYSPELKKEVEKTRFCYVVAFIRFDRKEWAWEFDSVGSRYIDDYVSGMTTWVKEWIEEFRNYNYPELEEN